MAGLRKSIGILVAGSAMAQAVNICATPVITRIYEPAAFGLFGAFLSITKIVTPIAALTLPQAIPLARSIAQANAIAIASISISLVVAATYLIGVFAVSLPPFHIAVPVQFLEIAPVVAIAILANSCLQVADQCAIQARQFRKKSEALVISVLLANVVKIVWGMIAPTASTLIVTTLIGAFAQAVILGLLLGIGHGFPNREFLFRRRSQSFNWIAAKDLIKTHKRFPLYRAPQVFLNALSQYLPLTIITITYPLELSGKATLAWTVVLLFTTMATKSVFDATYPEFARKIAAGESIKTLFLSATIKSSLASIPPFLTLFLLGEQIFELAFGQGWALAGSIAGWLALWAYTMVLSSVGAAALPVISRHGFDLLFAIVKVTVRVCVLVLGLSWGTPLVQLIMWLSSTSALVNLAYTAFAYCVIRTHEGVK